MFIGCYYVTVVKKNRSMWADLLNQSINQNGSHLKNIGDVDFIFDMHILGA